MKLKKLKLYFEKGTTIMRVKPTNHPLLFNFIVSKWNDIVEQHNSMTDEEKKKGMVVYYGLELEGMLQLQKELGVKDKNIRFYYQSLRKPLLVIRLKKEDVYKTARTTRENK